MGLVYLFALIVYIAISVGIYKIISKVTKKVWVKRVTIAFFILLPTYDIIITQALLFYYCNFTEKEKIYKVIEHPDSVYFEDRVVYPNGYSEKAQELLVDRYLIRNRNLKSIEVMTQKGTMAKYVKTDDGEIEKQMLSKNQPTAKYSVVKTSDYINPYIRETRYEYFDLQHKNRLGFIRGYNGKIPNMFFIYSSPGADGGSCSESLYKQDSLIIKLKK